MNECTHLRDRLEEQSWQGWQLSEDDVQHVRECSSCEREFEAQKDYVEIVAAARDALAAEGGLSPEAWSRLRSVAEKTEQRAILEWMLQPALAVAMAAMVFWIALASPSSEAPLDSRLYNSQPAQPSRTAVAPSGSADEPRYALGPGSVVAARSQVRELVAFDRHVMELSPRTRVTIVAWNPRRIVLNVTSGSVRAVVKRERDGDHFELRTSHVRARALGTDYRVSVRQQDVTTVRVAHGAVEVTDLASGVTRVQAGDTLRVGAKGPVESNPARVRETDRGSASGGSAPAPAQRRGTSPSKRQDGLSSEANPEGVEKHEGAAHGLKVIEIDIAPQSADPPGGG